MSKAEKEFLKDLVIGYAVIKKDLEISTVPLAISWTGEPDELNCNANEKIIAVIPAHPGTLQVWGLMPDDVYKVLGYQLPGADCPNWDGVLEDGFTLRDIYRNNWTGLNTKDQGKAACDLLIKKHWLKESVQGKTRIVYYINPKIFKKYKSVSVVSVSVWAREQTTVKSSIQKRGFLYSFL